VVIEVTDSGFDPGGEKRVSFSTREKQVVELLAQGLKNKEIAAAMNLAEGTVKVYLSRLFKKTKVRDRFELMLYRAQDRKLLSTDAVSHPTDNSQAPQLAEYLSKAETRAEALTVS
jgi:DNA-binding CsgD family transcriptional regulator